PLAMRVPPSTGAMSGGDARSPAGAAMSAAPPSGFGISDELEHAGTSNKESASDRRIGDLPARAPLSPATGETSMGFERGAQDAVAGEERVHHLHARLDAADHRVAAVEVRGGGDGDEQLAAAGVL